MKYNLEAARSLHLSLLKLATRQPQQQQLHIHDEPESVEPEEQCIIKSASENSIYYLFDCPMNNMAS